MDRVAFIFVMDYNRICMKKLVLFLTVLFCLTGKSFAHFMWIETNQKGKLGESQEIKVYFGEFTKGIYEKVDGKSFTKMKNFSLWVMSDSGERTNLEVTPKDNYYLATFTPENTGTYTVILDNDNIEVIDFSKKDFGIFKPHYHATAKIQVSDQMNLTVADNPTGITLKNVSDEPTRARIQVLYKGEILPNHELEVYIPDGWSQTLKTDARGMADFSLTFDTTYVVEVMKNEEVSGTYQEVDYEFIWHCATLSVKK